MRNLLERYLHPVWSAENDNGAVSSPAADPVVEGAENVEGTSSTSDETGAETEGEEKVVEAKASPSEAKIEEKKPDWRDKKIAKLTAKLRERVAPAEVPPPVDPAVPPAPTDQFNKMVQQAAAQQRAAEDFKLKCDNEAKAGREAYGVDEFTERLGNLLQLIDQDNPEEVTNYYRFLDAALETGKAKDLIFQLGDDLEEAEKIFSLSDAKLGVKLARLADAIESPAPEAVSGAPKPLTPVGGRSGDRNPIDPTDGARADQLSTAEWMKRRNAQVDARKAR